MKLDVDWGVKKYGNSFAEDINKSLGLKSVHMMQFQPSKDLGKLAVQSVDIPQIKTEGNLGWMLEKLITNAHNKESDFLSQLLFDQSYTKLAEELGFSDTQSREEEIIAFCRERLAHFKCPTRVSFQELPKTS